MPPTPASEQKPAGRRAAAAARTRATVLEAAARVIAEVGPDAASVERITTEASVSRGVVGWQFGSKSALVVEVVEASLRELAEALTAALTDDRPFTALAAAFEEVLATPAGRVLVTSLAHVVPDEDALSDTYSAGLEQLIAVATDAARRSAGGLTVARQRQRAVAFVSVLLGYATQRVLDPELDPATLLAAGAVFDTGAES